MNKALAISIIFILIGAMQITCLAIPNNFSNKPPTEPYVTGPNNCKVGVEYNWIFISTDPEEDNITYYIDWGGCGGAEWHGPYPSGEEANISHIYMVKNTYVINTLAVDGNGASSNWTYFEVNITKRTSFIYNFPFFSWLFERFPTLFPILRHVLEI
jgi:hypothetical protein